MPPALPGDGYLNAFAKVVHQPQVKLRLGVTCLSGGLQFFGRQGELAPVVGAHAFGGAGPGRAGQQRGAQAGRRNPGKKT